MRMGHTGMQKADLTSILARRHPRPNFIIASVAVSTERYFRLNSSTGIPSLTLEPSG